MKKELTTMLEGTGFLKVIQHRRKILTYVILGSLAAHVLGLLLFGSVVVMRAYLDKQTTFAPPPPTKTYEPRKLQHKVKVQQRQRSSSRPSVTPRLVSTKPSNLSLPEINMDPKVIKTTFQPKFKAVTGTGLGVGVGTGHGVGGLGLGTSSFNFFGIRASGERIAILVDVSVSMIEEERGGPTGFLKVKQRINTVIDALGDQTLFTVVAFANTAKTWKDELVIASDENRLAAKRFLEPINTENDYGLSRGNVEPPDFGIPAESGTTRLDLALYAAFEQGADTILVISDGAPKVKMGVTEEEREAYRKMREEWLEEHADEIEEWEEERKEREAEARYKTERVWVPGKPAQKARPEVIKEGKVQPARPARPATKGKWVTREVKIGGMKRPKPRPPGPPKRGYWELEDFLNHLEALHFHMYEKKGRKRPVIHTIGYQIDREGSNFLRKLAREYDGRYRRITRIR